jgi:carotenoid cleavage dioxygenase-like enzyme
MTATIPAAPAPIDMATQPHLSGVFAPVTAEIDVTDLAVEGELPAGIDGDYLRNGPNPRFSPLGGYLFPLDGDGMLHRVRIRDGKVGYGNRFVRTPALVAEERAGRALWAGFGGGLHSPGVDEVGPQLAGTFKDLPDINVVRHGGKLLALAEAANPFLMDDRLATVGRETWCGELPAGITAHPKIDPRIGEMVVFNYLMEAPYLTWSVIAADASVRRLPTAVPGVDRPVMIHDMALTERYVVLVLAPLFFDLAAAYSGGSMLSWEPDAGTRIALVPRDGSAVRWLSTEPFWMWHTANAHDAVDGTVVLDFVRWSGPGMGTGPATGSLARLTLDPVTGSVTATTLADREMEFPRIDDRMIAGGHRIIGTALESGRRSLIGGDSDMLGWYDDRDGSFATWDAGSLAVGEQTYVPAPGDPDPTHGWWTTIATDRTDLTSKLLIIPAADPTSGPVATVTLPQRVPLGLHGSWQPTQE